MKFLEILGFGKKEKKEDQYPHFVDVKIYEQILPVARGDRYEDPLCSALEKEKIGTVSGGGSMLRERAQEGERDIEYVNLDVELANLEEALTLTKQKLLELGVPINTEVCYEDLEGTRQTEIIGEMELLNIFIDNLCFPEEVYEKTDWDKMFEEMHKAVKDSGTGEFRADCGWESETLAYFAGASADKMYEVLKPITKNYPVMQNARVVFQRKDNENQPVELRLPKED